MKKFSRIYSVMVGSAITFYNSTAFIFSMMLVILYVTVQMFMLGMTGSFIR